MREPRPARIADETAPTRGAGFESRLGHTARAMPHPVSAEDRALSGIAYRDPASCDHTFDGVHLNLVYGDVTLPVNDPRHNDVFCVYCDTVVRAIAAWSDDHGSTYTWPQATVDNRRSRVLARIARFEIPCNPTTLTIVDVS